MTVIAEYTQLFKWATSKSTHYKRSAIDEFLQAEEVDAWLIAFALNQNISIVTHEKSAPNSKRKIKIPDVCHVFSVNYCTTIEMLRTLKEQL